jgi:hypothetical protein
MSTLHNSLMRRIGAPALMAGHGERDDAGELKPLRYRDPRVGGGEGEPYQLTGIGSPVRAVEEPDFEDGGTKRRETKTWQIPRQQFDEKQIDHPQRAAIVEDHDGEWNVDVTQCVWGAVFVTLALTRAPRTSGNEMRSAAV